MYCKPKKKKKFWEIQKILNFLFFENLLNKFWKKNSNIFESLWNVDIHDTQRHV